jgi:hypothetical protein
VRDPSPFGKYVLLERISVGGMAEVFKAKQFGVEGFEKILAIKRILPSLAEDSDFIEMFIDEAKICGHLTHANICQIYELGRVDDAHFIAMEYVWGKDLLQIQNRFRKLRKLMAPSMAAFIGLKMCEGLDYAHKKKDAQGKLLHIIHRDVSPQNILCSYEGEVKIIDFGIAKAATRSSKTQAGVLKGKFGYMSPEQVRGLPLDRRSDIFAIGTILYELLIADRLFVGESDFETLERVRNVDVPPITKTNAAVPPELEQIILKALAKDVEDRYQWAGDMQVDLQAFLNATDPTFGEKNIAAWMREQFAVEMKREQDVLDAQRKVGREVLDGAHTPAAAAARPASIVSSTPRPAAAARPASIVSSTPRPVAPAAAPSPAPDRPAAASTASDGAGRDPLAALFEGTEGLHADKTTITGPTFLPEGVELSAVSTQIVSPTDAARALAPLAAGGPAGGAPLKAESTVILDGTGSHANPQANPMMPKIKPEASTMLAMPAPVLPPGTKPLYSSSPAPAPRPAPLPPSVVATPVGAGQVMAPPPQARAPLWRDVLIGVGVAAAMIAAIFGARAFLSHGSRGTLVLTLNAEAPAEVRIDGEPRAKLRPGKPLTVKDLVPGDHELVVTGAAGAEWRQVVSLVAGDVNVVTAELRAGASATAASAALPSTATATATPSPAAGPGTGQLTLRVPPDVAQVYVDGAQLADGAWKQPIALRADVAHEIRVTQPSHAEGRVNVTLKAGEQVTREVTMSALGRIHVITEPGGAEIAVNGKRVGTSPVVADDLETGKLVRVTVRHRGYAPIIKYVNFDKGLEQNFEFKMVASKEDGYNASESAEPATATARPRPLVADKAQAAPGPTPMGDDAAGLKTIGKPSSDPGYLVANTQPWAKVFIDGHDTGKTTPIAPRSKIALKPGKHTVTFVVNGKKFNYDVNIKPNEDTRLIKQLTE